MVLAYSVRDVADFFRSLLLINKRIMWVGQIALAAAVLSLLANMLLIPAYGTRGAAWATLLTWFAYLVVCWIAAGREHRLPVRVGGLVLQMALDGVWVALFAALAAMTLLSAPERRAVLRQAVGTMAGRPVPAVPSPKAGGPMR